MGTIIPAQEFFKANVSGQLKPIIYCCSYEGITDRAVSINKLLAMKLSDCKPNRRTMRLESFFNQILEQLPDGAIIKDFDVMFSPEYKIDVLQILTSTCKKKPFSVIWPGRYEDGKLFYAKDGCLDFKTYIVKNYDIICII